MSSHKTDWLLSEFRCLLWFAFYIAWYAVWWMHLKENDFASAKCKQVACGVVAVYRLFLYYTLLLFVYFFIPIFYTDVIAIFLFIRWSGSKDLYNKDPTIILFTRNVSSHKTDWILSESPLPTLSCLLYRMTSNLVDALEREYLCLRKISINVHKWLSVLLLPVYLFIRYFILHFVVAFLFLNPFFILILLLKGSPNTFFWKCFKTKTTEYFPKFLFFIWKYNPSG